MMQKLSSLRLSKFFGKAADTFVDANDLGPSASRGRSGGTSNLSTISHPAISRPAPVQVRDVVKARQLP